MSPETPIPEQRNEAETRFLEATEKVDTAFDAFTDSMTREPWPEWQTKLALRMARIYVPTLKLDDLRNKPQVFFGYAIAAQFEMAKVSEMLNLSAFPESEFLDAAKKMIEGKGVAQEITESELFEWVKEMREQTVNVLLPMLSDTIAAAVSMPFKNSVEFFVSFGDGLNRHVGWNALKRLGDSSTVKICIFIISHRPEIEAGKFKTVSELIKYYYFQHDKEGEKISQNTFAQREAFAGQFRQICKEDGVKLAGRGRPRKAATSPPIERPKRSRSRKL